MIYLDTSYIVRLYFEDPGWQQVRVLAASDHVACCLLGYAETLGAFHRKLREGAVNRREFRAIIDLFGTECDAGAFQWLPLSHMLVAELYKTYAILPKTVHLRAGDAVHLACAAENGFAEIYSNDQHMLAAAAHFGLRAKNVI